MALDGQSVYEAHSAAELHFRGEVLPSWDDLRWSARDEWEAVADELNEAREPLPNDERE